MTLLLIFLIKIAVITLIYLLLAFKIHSRSPIRLRYILLPNTFRYQLLAQSGKNFVIASYLIDLFVIISTIILGYLIIFTQTPAALLVILTVIYLIMMAVLLTTSKSLLTINSYKIASHLNVRKWPIMLLLFFISPFFYFAFNNTTYSLNYNFKSVKKVELIIPIIYDLIVAAISIWMFFSVIITIAFITSHGL